MYYLEAQIFLSNTYLDRITLDLSINEYGSDSTQNSLRCTTVTLRGLLKG